jgi:hypothetical protein
LTAPIVAHPTLSPWERESAAPGSPLRLVGATAKTGARGDSLRCYRAICESSRISLRDWAEKLPRCEWSLTAQIRRPGRSEAEIQGLLTCLQIPCRAVMRVDPGQPCGLPGRQPRAIFNSEWYSCPALFAPSGLRATSSSRAWSPLTVWTDLARVPGIIAGSNSSPRRGG